MNKKFFRAFNYKPQIIYHIAKKRGGCWNKYITTSAKEYVKLKFQSEKELKIYKVEFIYPAITSEIILKLEEILFDNYYWFSHISLIHGNIEKGLKPMCKIVLEYESGYNPEYDSKEYSYIEALEETRADALLSILIQFKDEIQDQVRGLFDE